MPDVVEEGVDDVVNEDNTLQSSADVAYARTYGGVDQDHFGFFCCCGLGGSKLSFSAPWSGGRENPLIGQTCR